MKPVRVELRKIATVSTILAVVVIVVTLVITGTNWRTATGALVRTGVAVSVIGAFWTLYNKWLWHVGPFRLFGWLSPAPNLNGRWEGTVCRNNEDNPRPFAIEINQTYTSMSFKTFSTNSLGRSEAIWITRFEDTNVFGVIAVWQTTTRRIKTPKDEEETFRGTSYWELEYSDKPGRKNDVIRIVDKYHTSRKTLGKVEVSWVSRKRFNTFTAGSPTP